MAADRRLVRVVWHKATDLSGIIRACSLIACHFNLSVGRSPIRMATFARNSPLWGILSYSALVAVVIAPQLPWPPALGLVLDQYFFLGMLLYVLCLAFIVYLFFVRGGSTRWARFASGLLLIFASVVMNTYFEQIGKNNESLALHFPPSYDPFFAWLKVFIDYSKGVIAFGIAALGANLAASAIVDGRTKP